MSNKQRKIVGDNPVAVKTGDAPEVALVVDQTSYPENYEFFDNFTPDPIKQQELPFRPGVDHSPLEFRFFRPDEMGRLNGTRACSFWRVVKKDLAIEGLCMAELFVEESDPASPWDENGFIPYGKFITTPDGRQCKEGYLASRPSRAGASEKRLRARMSAESVNERHKTSGADAAKAADLAAKAHYRQAPDTAPLVTSSLTPFDQEMRNRMVTSQQYGDLGAFKTPD